MRFDNQEKTSVQEIILSLRELILRLSFIFLLAVALAAIAVSKFDNKFTETIRAHILDVAVPVLNVLSAPVDAYEALKLTVGEYLFVHDENRGLWQEVRKLRRTQVVAVAMEAENERLRELLHLMPEPGVSFITARVVGDVGSPYLKTALINSGTDDGIEKGEVVTNGQGLVGRITEIGRGSARIMLITDITSRIPVMTTKSRERTILTGMNTAFLSAMHIPENSKIREGETVVTSGDGTFFPSGIPVGVIHSISKNSVVIKPFIEWNRMDYVTIVRPLR